MFIIFIMYLAIFTLIIKSSNVNLNRIIKRQCASARLKDEKFFIKKPLDEITIGRAFPSSCCAMQIIRWLVGRSTCKPIKIQAVYGVARSGFSAITKFLNKKLR